MKIKRIFYALMGISLCITLQNSCIGKTASEELAQKKPNTLASATEAINERCPEWVDPESRLDSVILRQKGLYYYYTLPNKDKVDIGSNAFTAFLLPKIVENIHFNPDLKMHRDSSVIMFFNYLDKSGELITEFSVGPERYK